MTGSKGQVTSNKGYEGLDVMAQGSCDQVRVRLSFCAELGYINEELLKKYKASYEEVGKMLGGLIKAWGRTIT